MLRRQDPIDRYSVCLSAFREKNPISDRDSMIEELKAQEKWKGENQTENKTNDAGMSDNTVTVGKQEGNFNSTPESKSSPFISSVWVLAVVIGAVKYVRKKK